MTNTAYMTAVHRDENVVVYRRILLGCWLWVAYSGFVIEEILPFLQPIRMPVGLAVDGLIIVAGLLSIRRVGEIAALLSIIILSYISTIAINDIDMPLYINGMRDFVALIFLPPLLKRLMAEGSRATFIRRMDRQLYIWLWIQAFCILEEMARYGSGDHGGGSMGNGYSGICSTAIYIVSFYLMTRRWNMRLNYAQNLRANLTLVILLFPTFLNETKVSFVFFILYFILLFKLDRTFLPKLMVLIPVLAIFVFLAFTIYSGSSGQGDAASEEYLNEYLTGNAEVDIEDVAEAFQSGAFDGDDWDVDVPRMAKLVFLPFIIDDTKGDIFVGAGVGHFKGWDTGRTTQLYKDNKWLLFGTFPYLFSIGLQLGLLGLAWVIGFFVYNTRPRHNPRPLTFNIKIFIYIIVGIILFYNDSLRDMMMMIVLFYIALASSYPLDEDKADAQAPKKAVTGV